MTEQFFKPEDVISTYTSEQAVDDGILFDVDIILAKQPANKQFFLKYVTTGLLEQGYWNNRCKKGVLTSEAYNSQTCTRCAELFKMHKSNKPCFKMHKSNKPCLDRTLNTPNLTDLLNQATRIFRKKPADDYFVSGIIELPSGQKQKIFIAQNETGRYTVMRPEEY